MGIPCIRCQTVIEKANVKNAKYIMNADDERTYGNTNFSLFEVFKGKDRVDVYSKFVDAVTNSEERKQSILDEATAIQEEIKELNKDLDKAEIDTKNNEVALKIEEVRSVRVAEKMEIRSVPKTAIICRSEGCQNKNDIIIWG